MAERIAGTSTKKSSSSSSSSSNRNRLASSSQELVISELAVQIRMNLTNIQIGDVLLRVFSVPALLLQQLTTLGSASSSSEAVGDIGGDGDVGG